MEQSTHAVWELMLALSDESTRFIEIAPGAFMLVANVEEPRDAQPAHPSQAQVKAEGVPTARNKDRAPRFTSATLPCTFGR